MKNIQRLPQRQAELPDRRGGGGLSAMKVRLRWLESRSRDKRGLIMYFPTRSASVFVPALTRLWTEKPVCRQERILSAHSGLRSCW